MDDGRDMVASRPAPAVDASAARSLSSCWPTGALDQPSIVPVLASLAACVAEATRATAAAITVLDGQHRWITVTHGPFDIASGADLFPVLRDACGSITDQPVSLSQPARMRALCGTRLDVAGSLPLRLDALCRTGRDDAVTVALCVVNATGGSDADRVGASLLQMSTVVMRLLDLHDRLVDVEHVVMLSPHMGCVIDADSTIVALDSALHALLDLGPGPGPELDRQFRALVHPDDYPALAEAWRQALAGEIPVEVEYRLRVRGGAYRWFRAHAKPRRDAAGRITRWCALLEDVHERREDRMRLAHLAYHDALTGLCNRAWFRLAVERRLDPAHVTKPALGFAVARLELHEFRAVTDAFGHAIGDRLLLGVSKRLGSGVRRGDLLAHGGGNEFFLLLEGIASQQKAASVLDDLLHSLDAPMQVDGSVVAVGAVVGAALARDHNRAGGVDSDILMQNADLALLRARSAGRGACCFYSPEMDEKIKRSQALKVDMTRALDGDQLFLLYQPVLDMQTGRVTTLEALARWSHPTRGVVSPAEFIPEAERNGLIVPIGRWVLEQACRAAATWPSGLRVAVNLSSVQVRAPGLVETVAQALHRSGLEPARLVLEITESVSLLGEADNLATLRALGKLGVLIALDDFGTGYASLSYLQCFSFDMIKIERSFVQRMLGSEEARIILRAVIRLSRSLHSLSVAEGVETAEQLAVLREEGCDCVQGYLFSRPVEERAVPGAVAALNARAGDGFPSGRGLLPSCGIAGPG